MLHQQLLLLPEHAHVQQSVALLKKTLAIYAPGEVWLSFNGGKDATVVLQLTLLAIADQPQQLNAIYLQEQDSFQEVETFIQATINRTGIQLIRVNKDYKSMVDELDKHQVRAVIMGTRRTDPHSANLSQLSPTDPGYGRFLRVLPILDWDFHQVWSFLESFQVDYCSMYRHGYTYLGNKHNCRPNQHLLLPDGTYQHAKYAQDNQEFASRHLESIQQQVCHCVVIVRLINNYTYAKALSALLLLLGDSPLGSLLVLPLADLQNHLPLRPSSRVFLQRGLSLDCLSWEVLDF